MESLVTYNIFLTLSNVTLQVFELHVSDCVHILLFSLVDLNKDEAIYKVIFGISIYGTAWSYNNVKQLQIGMYISYRLHRTLTPSTLSITPFSSSLSYIQLHITPTHSLSLHLSCLCLLFHIILIYLIVSFSMYGVYSWL